MPSNKKNKGSRTNAGAESRPTTVIRSVLNNLKAPFSKSSKSEENQHGGSNTQESGNSTHIDSLNRSSPVMSQCNTDSARQPKQADVAKIDSKSSAGARKLGAFVRIIGELAGVSAEYMENEVSRNDSTVSLAKRIKDLMELNIPEGMRSSLENLHSVLSRLNMDDDSDIESARWRVTNCLQMFLLENLVTGSISPNGLVNLDKQLWEIQDKAREDALRQAVTDFPCAEAAYNDYTAKNQSRTSCFEGTRVALLMEISKWLADSESNVYVLFGLAGIGKSTIAQTISEKADQIHLLGASFFFSRDEADRRNAKMFFTTIAFHLCVHDPEFAVAIESVMLSEKGKAATTKLPLEQLETLILEPLRKLASRKVVIVVDALDECDVDDVPTVLVGLNKLVQGLPSFKVFLTTRPLQHPLPQTGQSSRQIFHLHDIEGVIVDGDIERYLRHNLSLEQVKARLPKLRDPWAASDEEIKSLVRGAGRLFIIASTAVLFILDKTRTPASRMKELQMALDEGRTPLNKLNDFYTVILQNAVPKDCEPGTAKLYQRVIGAIILLQQPLPVSALAKLVDLEVNEIITVLGNLESVILLGSNDIPVVYHKSFPDYILDPARCKDENLRIDLTSHHTRMAIHCLQLLNRCLKQNIMDLVGPARFMNNDEALENQGLTGNHVWDKIPLESQYACSYFANHIQSVDEDADLAKDLQRFFDEHFLNWLEALSWIRNLDTAHHTLLTVQRKLKPTASDLFQLVSDGLRFFGKFYEVIKRSALHIYHSALSLTPTGTSLYTRYSKQMSFCRVQGGQGTWDAVVTDIASTAYHVVFSQDSASFACFTVDWRKDEDGHMTIRDDSLTIHDAVAGIPLGRIEGQVFTITNDFSKAAAFDDGSIALYTVKGVTPVAIIKLSATISKLALSPDGSRLVAGLDDGTVGLWDTETCTQIESVGRWEKDSSLIFSSDGSRTTFISCDEVIKLLDGMSGKAIADLRFPMLAWPRLTSLSLERPGITFSGDSSRLACLAVRESEEEIESALRVWNSHDGTLVGTAEDVGYMMAISTDGSLIATGWKTLKLWNGNDLTLLEIPNLELEPDSRILCLAFHNDLLGIGCFDFVVLYGINSHTFIARLPISYPLVLAFSPDSSRLAAGGDQGEVRLWDVPSITSNFTSRGESSELTDLAFSPDCLRLVSAHKDGAIKLWNTSNMVQIAVHKGHSAKIRVLGFGVDGENFASGSEDGVIQLWNGKDGAPEGILECSAEPTALTLLSSMLAVATNASITLRDLRTHAAIATFDQHDSHILAFSHHQLFLAAATITRANDQNYRFTLTLWDIEKRTRFTTFNLNSHARRMQFLPDDSQLAIQCFDDTFHLFNPHDSIQSLVSENYAISQLGICPTLHGIPVWTGRRNGVLQVLGFLHEGKTLSVLDCTRGLQVEETAVGSSMIALGCEDGCILLIKVVYDD